MCCLKGNTSERSDDGIFVKKDIKDIKNDWGGKRRRVTIYTSLVEVPAKQGWSTGNWGP